MASQLSADGEVVEESDKNTIKKVYDKYMQEYNRMPHSVELFVGFAKKFHDVKISFASAKSFLDEISQTSSDSVPTFLAPNFAKMKLSSISTPNVLTNSNIRKKKTLKSNLNEKYHSVNDLQLLKDIKEVIMNMDCIKNSQQIANELNNAIWNNIDSSYLELTKRLARGRGAIGHNAGSHLRPSLHQPSLSKDEDFLSLKDLSQRIDVDDVDHDVSVYLLKTFYRDEVGDDGDYDFDEQEEALSLYDSMVLRYRKTMRKELASQPDQLTSHKSAPPQSRTMNISKRLSLSLDEKIKPDFSYMTYSIDSAVMDKAFRALSTVSSASFETVSVGTEMLLAFDEDEEKEKNSPFVDKNFLDVMSKYESKMDCWDFDVFEFMDDAVFCGKGLVYLSFFLFRKVGLLDSTGVSQTHLWRFFEMVGNGYLDANPYHNQYHAVDVLLNTHFFFQSDFMKCHMTQWDKFAAYIAALCHDLGHMGFNNGWYVNTAGNLALLYGDESVLENYHLNETFRLLNKPASNWMLSFTSSIRKYLSIVIKDCILATDVKRHGVKVHQLQNIINVFKKEVHENDYDNFNSIQLQKCQSMASYASIEAIKRDGFKLFVNDEREHQFDGDIIVNDMGTNDDEEGGDEKEKGGGNMPMQARIDGVLDERLFILGITIHTCDVANPCKPLDLCIKWADNYLEEVFMQGDTERSFGIPVSPGMDRHTTKLPNSQIGFITYVVKRLFELYSQLIKEAETCLQLMRENEKHWIQEKKDATIYKVAKKPGLVSISEAKTPKSVKFKD